MFWLRNIKMIESASYCHFSEKGMCSERDEWAARRDGN